MSMKRIQISISVGQLLLVEFCFISLGCHKYCMGQWPDCHISCFYAMKFKYVMSALETYVQSVYRSSMRLFITRSFITVKQVAYN